MNIEHLPQWITALPKEWAVFIVAAIPVFELRGSIPLGLLFKMPITQVLFWSILGNIAPIVLLLPFFGKFFARLQNVGFFKWWFARVEKQSKSLEKWEFWGLAIFVGVPLPGTGAWSGAVAATLLKMRFGKALLSIFVGVLIAAAIVALLATGAIGLWFKFI